MRIIWNESESWFQAEISLSVEHWRDDVAVLKLAHFKTDGPPTWRWFTNKIAPLDYLRKHTPKSGLTITELALSKYKFLKDQADKKAEIKKDYKKAASELASTNWKSYVDEDTGIVCKQVLPSEEKFVWKYTPPPAPEVFCFVCGDAIYSYEYPDSCLWCNRENKA